MLIFNDFVISGILPTLYFNKGSMLDVENESSCDIL